LTLILKSNRGLGNPTPLYVSLNERSIVYATFLTFSLVHKINIHYILKPRL